MLSPFFTEWHSDFFFIMFYFFILAHRYILKTGLWEMNTSCAVYSDAGWRSLCIQIGWPLQPCAIMWVPFVCCFQRRLKTRAQTFLAAHLDWWSCLYMSIPASQIKCLYLGENFAARYLSSIKHTECISVCQVMPATEQKNQHSVFKYAYNKE